MDKVNEDLFNLMAGKSASGEYCLFDVLQESRVGSCEIEGVDIRYLLQLNDLVRNDAERYFSMIEQTRHYECAYVLLLFLVREHFYSPMNDSFRDIVEKAGEKGLVLIVKAMLLEYLNPQDGAQDNGQLVMQILRLRADVRDSLILTIVLVLIYETQGALDGTLENLPRIAIRQRKLDLLKKVVDEYNKSSQISTDVFRQYFGIEKGWDVEEMRRAEETGKMLRFDERYAAALMVSRQLMLALPGAEYEMLILGALRYNSQASIWKERSWCTLSVYLADAIASIDDVEELWQKVALSYVQALHRLSHQYYLGDSSNGCSGELYLCMLPNLIDRLLSAGRMELATRVWTRAWNDCLTALYSWPLPIVPFHVTQLLLYHKVMGIPSDLCSRSSVQMLNDLPSVFLPGGYIENTANACLSTLSRNCKDFDQIKLDDPMLYQKLEHHLENCK